MGSGHARSGRYAKVMTVTPHQPPFAAARPQRTENRAPRKGPESIDLTHPLFDRSQRRLRELVDVCMASHDGMPLLSVLLSRVPSLGEEVVVEASTYRVIGVQHASLDPDGRARFGTHAYLTVVEVPDADLLKRPASPVARRPHTKRSSKKPSVD